VKQIDVNKILTSSMTRITSDAVLKTLLGIPETGEIQVIKGPRRPASMTGYSFTTHSLTMNIDPDSKARNGTLLINFYCPNYSGGNPNIELMGPIADRVSTLFDDQPLAIDGYNNFNLVVEEPLGPLFDPSFPAEHFMSIRLKFNLFKKGSA
jgi:hypothetical protein